MKSQSITGSYLGGANFIELLRYRAERQQDDVAFLYLIDGEQDENPITYGELDRRARAIGGWLQSLGMSGERALLLYPPGIDYIAAYFGCLYAGVVAVPAYPPRRNHRLERIEMIGDDAEARVALTTSTVYEQVQKVIDRTSNLGNIKWLTTDKVEENLEDRWAHPTIHDDTIAFLQYTSGSTGSPKGVILTHGNLMHNSAQICYGFEQTRSGAGVFWLPSYHDMGLIGGILQPVYIGRPNVLMSPMSFLQKPFRWLDAISRHQGSICGGPNFAYDLCVDKVTEEQKQKLDLSSWDVAFNGAEPVRPRTLERFAEAFAECGFRRRAFYPCYGLAEGTLIVTGGLKLVPPKTCTFEAAALKKHRVIETTEEDKDGRELVGCGSGLLDQRIVVADPEKMTLVPPGHVGEIWAAGPSIAKGYWRKADDTQRTFHAYLNDTGEGPFLRTGDLGFIQDGELFVTGRLKDLIIIRGVNLYPQDIELTVSGCHDRIRQDCVAAFMLDSASDDRLVVVAEVRRNSEEYTETIISEIRKAVSREHGLPPDAIVLIRTGSIPKTSSGKIRRRACRDAFSEKLLRVVAAQIGWQQPTAKSETSQEKLAEQPSETQQPAGDSPVVSENGAPAESKATLTPNQDTLETVLDHVRRVAKERAAGLTADSNIAELGLDSLERMEIIASLEDLFGGRIPEEVLPEIETPREVAAAVEMYIGRAQHHRKTIPEDQEIPDPYYQFALFPEYLRLAGMSQAIDATGIMNPYFNVHQRVTNNTALIEGREMVNFSSYNYLGMSGDPIVTEASKKAIDQFGSSVSASRLVSGEKTLHRELERAIADLIGAADSVVFVGGHATNETTIGHLFGPGDLILHDSLAHNSILQGAILSGARRRSFPHNDYETLNEMLVELRRQYRRVLIAIEGVYSMDGDYPDLPKFIEVRKRHKAFLMVDEAHSIGVMGPHGRGLSEHFEVDPADVDLWMGTLSKAFGSCGGYIAGCKEVVKYLKYTSPGFVYSVGLSPANAAAALASIRLLEEEPERPAMLIERSKQFLGLAKKAGLNTGTGQDTPVIPIITGNSMHALQLSEALFKRGVNVQPIMYPAVEEKAARLRFFITSKHTEEQIRLTVAMVAKELAKINPDFSRAASKRTAEKPSTDRSQPKNEPAEDSLFS